MLLPWISIAIDLRRGGLYSAEIVRLLRLLGIEAERREYARGDLVKPFAPDMPRKKVRRERRRFDVHPCELAWLAGEPYPISDAAEAFMFLDSGLRRLDVALEKGCAETGFEPLTPEAVPDLESDGSLFTLHATLRRLRSLYDGPPAHVRQAIPRDWRALLEAVKIDEEV